MAKLKVPSLQHLARNLRDTPDAVSKKLIAVALNPPQFSYEPLFGAVRDMLVLGVPFEQVAEGIRRGEKRPMVRATLLEVLPMLRDHFAGIEPDGPPRRVARRYYPLAQDIVIPFEAPLEYSAGGQVYFPWFSFWRSNPLADKRLSLFVTVVEEVLLQDPDLDTAIFQILDFSRPNGEEGRRLQVIDASEIPRLNHSEKRAMLEVFADGYRKARAELIGAKPSKGDRDDVRPTQTGQGDLFGRSN
ncbi:MAG: hypothetical protein AB7L90_20975 [Hyphomicrobiaceae bacterium]